jgi:hypothetical protein
MHFIRPGKYDYRQWDYPQEKNIPGVKIGHNPKVVQNEKEKKGQHVA